MSPAIPENVPQDQALMMQSNLVPDKYGDDAFEDLAKVGNYLAYIQLCGSSSKPVQRGQIKIGNHALFKGKQVIDLGQNVNCWICAWRPMALLTSGEKPVAFYDPKSEGFKKVQEEASKPGQTGAMAGPQFLLYLPEHGFVTYLMASKTAKNEAPNFKALMDKCAIISSKFIETKKYNWHGPTIVASSTQFATPNPEEYIEVLQNFKNPPETTVELADAPQDNREM